MSSSLPADVIEVFRNFRTAELTTISRAGEPITWPVATEFDPGPATFLVTTSIGLPNKALQVRRKPKVALLFSNPAASGLESPPAVLVQGKATVEDRVVLVEGLEEYWKKLLRRQPASQLYSLPLIRRFADFYYMRLVISVLPIRITLWEDGDFSTKPTEVLSADAG